MLPILRGLHDIHVQHIYHRDIKPANIFIRKKTEQPVLIDFGAAKKSSNDSGNSQLVHTAGYAPIEQLRLGSDIGPWTDIYAVGAMIWRIIANQNPIDSAERDYAINSLNQPDPMISAQELGAGKYSPPFLAAIDKAIALRAVDRFQSCDDFIDTLISIGENVNKIVDRPVSGEPITIKVSRPSATEQSPKPRPPKSLLGASTRPTPQTQPESVSTALTYKSSWVFKGVIGAAAILVIIAGLIFIRPETVQVILPLQTADGETKPTEDLVLTKIERMYEQSNKCEADKEYKLSNEATIAQLRQIGDEDSQKMIEIYVSKVQESRLSIQRCQMDLVDTAFDLTKSYQKWDDTLKTTFNKKIDLEKGRGNQGKANVIDGFLLTIRAASDQSDDSVLKRFLAEKFDTGA
jgi:serine/threonine protein kinase